MINLYRCKICGEAYVGEVKPSHCPFCGAHTRWLVEAKDYVEPEDFEIKEVQDPDMQENQKLLKVKACGICKTDEHIHKGHFISKFPLIPGHEFAGVIEKMGSDVKGLKVGDRVTCDNTVLCGTCSWCKKDMPLFCENFYSMGVTGPGGFAEYAAVNYDKCFILTANKFAHELFGYTSNIDFVGESF